MCITLCAFCLSSVYAANTTSSTPSLVTKINSAFTKIQGYLKKISTPIAGVCLSSGILIRKLSFGDERKMVIGKRIISNTVVGYAAIQLMDVIIKFIEAVVK
jgi:hypothetical protein